MMLWAPHNRGGPPRGGVGSNARLQSRDVAENGYFFSAARAAL